ncbi:MAG: AEC family transporter [Lachnospiraceae bacterium]|nr:AEC family transporter [Lachnospiraceae bacterium]
MKELATLQVELFTIILIGALMKRRGIIGEEGKRSLTDLVILLVLPCNIITSFANSKGDNLKDCLLVFFISLFIQIFCIIYGKVAYRKEESAKAKNLHYGIICSNAGFLGTPIAEGLWGAEGLMLASVYLLPQRVVMWSAGLSIYSGSTDRKKTIKKVVTHPCVVACMVGIILMFLPFSLPDLIMNPIQTIGRCNTALSMFVIGTILADLDLRKLADHLVIRYTMERLIFIPLLVLIGCRLCRVGELNTSLSVILAAMPAGASTSMLAVKYDQDPDFATRMVIFSTLCSLPTLCIWTLIL